MSQTSKTVSVSPATPHVGDSLDFKGTGWAPGEPVTIVVYGVTGAAFFGATAAADGSFDTASSESFIANAAGDYQVSAFQGHGQKADAIVHFTVS